MQIRDSRAPLGSHPNDLFARLLAEMQPERPQAEALSAFADLLEGEGIALLAELSDICDAFELRLKAVGIVPRRTACRQIEIATAETGVSARLEIGAPDPALSGDSETSTDRQQQSSQLSATYTIAVRHCDDGDGWTRLFESTDPEATLDALRHLADDCLRAA